MKILIGMPSEDSWGGPAACEPPFVDALRRQGIEVDTETYVYGDKELSTPMLSRAVRVVRTALRFRRRLSKGDYEIVHLNTAFDKKTIIRDAISIALMRPKRAKVFLKIHGAGAHLISAGSFLYSRLIRFLDRRVAGYGIFTREELETFRAHGLDAAKFHLVKNVVELPSTASARAQKERSDTFELLFVSRFISTKGLLETIRACAVLRDRGAKFRLRCVGDGPLRSDAERLTDELGLNDMVNFTGYVSESAVSEYFYESDIFVFPTRHTEGFPIVLFKAAIAGLPIVTTRVRAAAEYFSEPENCLFCSADPSDIAGEVAWLIDDAQLRQRMKFENRRFAEMLTPDAVAREYVEVYGVLS